MTALCRTIDEDSTDAYTIPSNGIIRSESSELVKDGNYIVSDLVETGDVDAMLTGLTHNYPNADALAEITCNTVNLVHRFDIDP